MEEIEKLKLISLVSRLTNEISNYTGVTDKTLAEFVLEIHSSSSGLDDFKQKLNEAGAEFPESFIENLDRIICQLHPNSKKAKSSSSSISADQNNHNNKSLKEKEKVFKGLALPDTERLKPESYLNEDSILDDALSQLKGSSSKRDQSRHNHRRSSSTRSRSPSVSRSPPRSSRSSRNGGSHSHSHRRRSFSEEEEYDSDDDRRERRRHRSHRDRSPDDRHRGGRNGTRDRDSRSSRKRRDDENLDDEPILNKVYEGRVINMTDFGAFVSLEGIKGSKDGLIHISAIHDGPRLEHPSEVLQRDQPVKVKVIKIDGKRISLSMKAVDQETGEDLESIPSFATGANSFGLRGESEDPMRSHRNGNGRGNMGPPVKRKKRLTSPERWEIRQLIASGALSAADYPELNEDRDAMENPDDFEQEEDVDIEVREEEPPFLAGQTKQSLELSPIRVVKAPEGSLNRAAMSGASLARERREQRQQQAKDKAKQEKEKADLSSQWQDPLAQDSTKVFADDFGRKSLAFSDMPEWRKATRFSKDVSYGKRTNLSIEEQRRSLPVYQLRDELIKAVRENQILIVVGDTGSGKTTQITQYLAEEKFATKGMIGCTQPRRVAAVSVAKRVAEEAGCRLGAEVGYTIRFEDCTSPKTRIKYMTDGMLQREALLDPDMSQYSVIMLDEAHERTIATDVLFALLKKAAKRRPDLRLIITSATLDAEKFSEYFFKCPIMTIPGRTFPVEIMYTKEPEFDYLDAALMTVIQIHLSEPQGDILVFLTGQEEIDTSCEVLYERMKALGPDVPELIVLPVYSALPSEMQSKIFDPAPPGSRKVVIATNIAETSITIDGIYYVVDPGFVKINAYDPKLGMDSLVISPISQAQANQRAGRAGRTGPGKCYRLYTEQAYQAEMLPNTIPEIQRQNLSHTILMLKAMGINDLLHFDFMDPPPANTMLTALEELHSLLALDDEGLLTRLGRKMADFPMEPSLAKVLIASVDSGCSEEMLTIVAMLSVQNVFYRPKEKQTQADQKRAKFNDVSGDHIMLLNVYTAWERNGHSRTWCVENFIQERSLKRAQDVRRQLVSIMDRYKHAIISCGPQTDMVRKVLCSGFFRNAARKDPQEGYKTLIESTPVYLHPSSALFGKAAEYVIYHTLLLTTKEYMHCVTTINPKWLAEAAPTFFKVADPTHLSKRKRNERIQPLFDRYANDPNAWRLSAQRRSAKGGSSTFG